jgi:hypothetical protein
MEFKNFIRHATAVGFGLALICASAAPVHAQEIVNTSFPNGPYVSSFDQTAASVPATASAPSTAAVAPNSVAVPVAVPTVAEQAAVSASDYLRDTLIASACFGLLLVTVYAIAELRRSAFPLRRQLTRRPLLS